MTPEDLSDILVTLPEDAAVAKKRTKRITNARNLTSDEYTEMLRRDDRKKKEAEKLKEKEKVEREQKKKEREEKKKEREEKKKEMADKRRQREAEKKKTVCKRTKKTRRRARRRICSDSSLSEDEVPNECPTVESVDGVVSESDREPESSPVAGLSRPKRCATLSSISNRQ